MKPSQSSYKIFWLETAESTNRTLREHIDQYDNLSVIAAREQTAGRGQGTHTWFTTPGLNLTFSLLYKPDDLATSDILLITCATTLGIRDYLLSKGVTARIKWPNDIWVGDQKICGILIENILDGKRVSHSIIGIGLNINEENWPEDLPNPVSLKQLTGKRYDLEPELEQLTEKICRRFAQVDTTNGRLQLQEEFEKYLFRLDEEVR
ncbi:MAG: biotin--[acetyl-CoA-carboxylase] ligase [Bacteroidales bacterium]|nr:biotin--[acetyl-CoA-carboxylase] ligase [Bacteroidales bacterium]